MKQIMSDWWRRESGGREVLCVALPLVISTSSWTLMYFIDRMFLLWYHPDALAAALPASLLNFSFMAFFWGVASYVNTFVAQYHGARRPERIGLAVWQGALIGVVAMPWFLMMIPLAPRIFAAVGHVTHVQQFETTYFSILCYGSTGMVISAALASFYTGRGKVWTVVLVDSGMAAVNIVFDYLWIFGHAGFGSAGIAGAGWATVCAFWFRAAMYLFLMLRPATRREYQTLAGCRFDLSLFTRLLRYGAPSGLQFLLETSAFTAFLLLVGRLGALELTATNLAFNVNSLAFMPMMGLGIAATTLVGQRLGENRPEMAARSTWTIFTFAAVYMSTMAVVYVTVPQVVLFAYGTNADPVQFQKIREITALLMRFLAAFALFDAMNVIFSNAVKGAGDTKFVLWTTVITAPLPIVPTWLGIEYLGLGLFWSWTAVTAWVCALGSVFFARFWQGKWRTMRVIESTAYLADVQELPIEPIPAVTGETS